MMSLMIGTAHLMFFLGNIIERNEWAGHVARMVEGKAYAGLVEKIGERDHF